MKFLSIVFICASSLAFAQSNYHAGYVLKNNGDTLKGFINYREWATSPLSIEFKTIETNTEVLKFNPKTIRSFQINGMENYISFSGNISMNLTELQNLPATFIIFNKNLNIVVYGTSVKNNICN
jgi:hypothetical protein